MTLRELVLKMNADERLLIKDPDVTGWIECTPDEVINDLTAYGELHISTIQMSKAFNAIMIELE
jgi:hypothetical protein